MKFNVGGIDRILRIIVGIVLIALTLMGTIGV
ncbi:MAG: YgaP-like transmembrane domain, partial [Thiomonas sp.]